MVGEDRSASAGGRSKNLYAATSNAPVGSGHIAPHSTASAGPAATDDAFGQVLQSVRDAITGEKNTSQAASSEPADTKPPMVTTQRAGSKPPQARKDDKPLPSVPVEPTAPPPPIAIPLPVPSGPFNGCPVPTPEASTGDMPGSLSPAGSGTIGRSDLSRPPTVPAIAEPGSVPSAVATSGSSMPSAAAATMPPVPASVQPSPEGILPAGTSADPAPEPTNTNLSPSTPAPSFDGQSKAEAQNQTPAAALADSKPQRAPTINTAAPWTSSTVPLVDPMPPPPQTIASSTPAPTATATPEAAASLAPPLRAPSPAPVGVGNTRSVVPKFTANPLQREPAEASLQPLELSFGSSGSNAPAPPPAERQVLPEPVDPAIAHFGPHGRPASEHEPIQPSAQSATDPVIPPVTTAALQPLVPPVIAPQPSQVAVASLKMAVADRRGAARAQTEISATQAEIDPTLQAAAAFVPPLNVGPAVATPATAPAHTAPPPSPTAQLAPTLVTLARTADGANQMTIRLHPVELGMVQIRIERAASGLTQIDITADKPDTLLALQRDQPALHRTLDQAGVPSSGRTISFHATSTAPPSSSAGSNTNGQDANHHPSFGRSGQTSGDADNSSGGGRGGYFARDGNRWQNARDQAERPEVNSAGTPAGTRVSRAGLDITA